MKIPRNAKFVVGVFFLLIGLFTLVGGEGGKNEKVISSTFASEPVKVQGFIKRDSLTRQPNRIIVPKLSIDLNVDEAKEIDGYWEVFEDKAGWGEGSGIPGEAGNQVIFAHVREGLFKPLKNIKKGMNIYVLAESAQNESELANEGTSIDKTSGWYDYEVVEIKEVFPNQVEVIAPTDDETLTLYTCAGYSDSKRLIVIAKRIN